MTIIKKGKYVRIDTNNPKAVGQCDRSGFIFNHADLVKQMEWQGNSLKWTGLMVGRPFLDKPNEQLRPPLVMNDPTPVKNPRPPKYESPSNPALDLEAWRKSLQDLDWGWNKNN